jgi:hypothetical protein
MLRDRLLEHLPLQQLDQAAQDVMDRRRDPYTVIRELLDRVIVR